MSQAPGGKPTCRNRGRPEMGGWGGNADGMPPTKRGGVYPMSNVGTTSELKTSKELWDEIAALNEREIQEWTRWLLDVLYGARETKR